MTGNISSNDDLAYYCPQVPSAALDQTRSAICLPIIEPTVYYIAESVSESVR